MSPFVWDLKVVEGLCDCFHLSSQVESVFRQIHIEMYLFLWCRKLRVGSGFRHQFLFGGEEINFHEDVSGY